MPFSQTPPWGGARGRWGGAGPAWCVQLLYPPSRPPWVMVPWSLSPGQRTEMPMTQTVSNRQSTERGFCSQAHPLRLGNGSCTPTYLTPLSSRWTPPTRMKSHDDGSRPSLPCQAGPHLSTHCPREAKAVASELPGTQVLAARVQCLWMLRGHREPLPLTLTLGLPTNIRLALPSPTPVSPPLPT